MASGEVCTFGWGEHGLLGHGDEERKLLPTVVVGLRL
jgi:alpha-tubulin suppressor-like RCC1 family protein